MDLSDDSGDEAANAPVTAVDENELLNSDDEEGGRHILHNTLNEEELLYEGDEDEVLDFEGDDVLDIVLEDDSELDTPSGRSGELSPIKLRNVNTSVADHTDSSIETGDVEGQATGQEGDDSLLDTTDEGQNVGSPDEDSTSKPIDSDDDDEPRTRGRFLTERKTEDISKMGTSSMGGSEGKPITTLGERNPRVAHYPDSRRGGRGGGFNRQNLGGPRQFGPRGMMMGNPNLRHRQPSLLGDHPRPLLRFPNYNQQLQGGFIDFNQPLRPHGNPVGNTQSPPKAQGGPGGGFPPGSSPPNNFGQPEQQQHFNNVPGSPQHQQQKSTTNNIVNKSIGNRSSNVAPQKRPLAPRIPQQNAHLRPRVPIGAQSSFLSPPTNPNQQRPILPRQGGPPHRQHRPNMPPQQNLNRPQFPGQQQHWRPNSPHSPQQLGQRGMPPGMGLPPGVGSLEQEPQQFNNNFPPQLGPQPHGNFGSDNLVPPGVGPGPGGFPNRQPFIPPPSIHQQFSSPEESQHLMYRNIPQQQQPILTMQHPQPPNNPNLFMQQQPQQFPPHQEHAIPPPHHHQNNPFYIVRHNAPNVGPGEVSRVPSQLNQFNQPGRHEEYRQYPGQMPHHLHQQQQEQGWPGPPHHHQGEIVPPQFQHQQQQQSKMHSSFQQQQSPQEHYQQQNPFLGRRGPDGNVIPLSRNEPRYGREGSSGGDSYDKSSYHHPSSGSDTRSREFSQERYDSATYGDSYRDHDSKARSSRGSPRSDGYRTGHDRPPMKRTNDYRDEQSYGGGSPEKRLHGRLGPPVPKQPQREDPDPRKDEVIKIIKESQKVTGVDAGYLEKMEEQKRLRDRILREKEERRKHQQHSSSGGGVSSGCDDDDVQNFSREVNIEPSRREVRILNSDRVSGTKKIIRAPRSEPQSSSVGPMHHEDQSTTNKSIYVNPKAFNGDLSVLNTNLKMINMNVRSMGGSGGTLATGNTKVVTSTSSSSATNFGLSQNIAGMGPTTKKKTILRIVRNKKGEIISKSKVIVLPKQSRDGSSTVSVSTSA